MTTTSSHCPDGRLERNVTGIIVKLCQAQTQLSLTEFSLIYIYCIYDNITYQIEYSFVLRYLDICLLKEQQNIEEIEKMSNFQM